jgi:hypothetical protein
MQISEDWRTTKQQLEVEIGLLLSESPESVAVHSQSTRNRNIWYHRDNPNLRLTEYGFKCAQSLYTPYNITVKEIMTGSKMFHLLTYIKGKPWFLTQRHNKFEVSHWDEQMQVSWVMSGENWDVFVSLNA